MSTGQMTMGIITIVLAMIIAVAGAVWAISERINASHVELLEENAKTRAELLEENAKIRAELLEENAKIRAEFLEESAKTRVEIEKLRGDVERLRGDIERLESKFDEFKDSHEREHDLFYGQGDSENPAPPN